MRGFFTHLTNSTYYLIEKPNNFANQSTNWSSTLDMLGQFFSLTMAFIFVLVIAIYSLKGAAKFKGLVGATGNIKVLESRALGAAAHVHIVKIGEKHMLIGSTKDNISFLADIDAENIVINDNTQSNGRFDNQLKASFKRLYGKQMDK